MNISRRRCFRSILITGIICVCLGGDLSIAGDEQPYLFWDKAYDGGSWDAPVDILQTKEGDYVLLANLTEGISPDPAIALLKTDIQGNLRMDHYGSQPWLRYFQGQAYDFQQTKDGGFIIVGTQKSREDGSRDVYFAKTDAEWNIQSWTDAQGNRLQTQGQIGGTSENRPLEEVAKAVRQTSDGGYIIAASTDLIKMPICWLIKLDANTNVQWNVFLSPTDFEVSTVQETADKGFIIVGTFGKILGIPSLCVVKTDANGKEEWSQNFWLQNFANGVAVRQRSDGGYAIIGQTPSFGGLNNDIYLLHLDAQGDLEWSREFGGDKTEEAASFQQTVDGGYIIVGSTTSFISGFKSRKNIYLVKTDALGNQEWSNIFGGSNDDQGIAVAQASDGGYIVTGSTQEDTETQKRLIYLVKTDAKGTEEWSRIMGGSVKDYARSFQNTPDGGYIVTGSTRGGGMLLLKTDCFGNKEWVSVFGGAYAVGESVRRTSDGGYIVVGAKFTGIYVVKTDGQGKRIWEKTFGDGFANDKGKRVLQTSDGGYIILCDLYSKESLTDIYIMKIDVNGGLQWTKSFGGEKFDNAYSIEQTSDGGFVIVGSTESLGQPGTSAYLIKTDALGNQEWAKTFKGKIGQDQWRDYHEGCAVQQTEDGGYIIAGRTSPEKFNEDKSDTLLIKTDRFGNQEWLKQLGGEKFDAAYSVAQTQDGGCVVCGETESLGAGGKDIYVVKVDRDGQVLWSHTFGGPQNDIGRQIIELAPGRYVLVGENQPFSAGESDVYMLEFKIESEQSKNFIRGDVNEDGRVELSDATSILDCLFSDRCKVANRDTCDINDDGRLTIGDPIRLLNYLFATGLAPAAPFPAAGPDPTPDNLK